MTDEILREAGGSMLTMSMIGCLPDNVQQAMKSFSIRPGKQHITFCFPFMADILRRFKPEAFVTDVALGSQQILTPGIFFDNSIEVISGYQSFITLAPTLERSSMPIVLFTLYQRDTSEGILKHFESVIKILLDNKTLLSVWKMPLAVVDLSSQLLDQVIDTCAQTILDIQNENLLNTFPEKSKEELLQFIKDKMLLPYFTTYQQHFDYQVKEVAAKLRASEPDRFISLVDHLRSVSCTALDFQKADMMLKGPATEPLIKSFWRIWSQDQLASKVFPVVMASRSVHRVGPFLYSPRPLGPSLDPNLAGLTHVPIKEGLQSIIKCLKAQDLNSTVAADKSEKMKGCSCSVCKTSGMRYTDARHRHPYWDHPNDMLRVQSAFYRPTPTSRMMRHNHAATSTPYSDALKAAAILPHRLGSFINPSATSDQAADPMAFLRNDFRRTFMGPLPTNAAAPYWYNPAITAAALQQFKLSPTCPSPESSSPTSVTAPIFPLMYKPTIISQNSDNASEQEEPERKSESRSPAKSASGSEISEIDP